MLADDLDEQRLLAGEVLVDGLLGDRRQRGDLVHVGAEIAALEEDLGRRVEDRLVLVRRPARASSLHRFAVVATQPSASNPVRNRSS